MKCDRTPDRCQRCCRFGAECIYESDSISSRPSQITHPAKSRTQAGLQRKRIWRSCTQCKQAKAKCSGGSVCTRCARKALRCSHGAEGVPRCPSGLETRSHATPLWLKTTDLPPEKDFNKLIEIYFERVHTVRCLGFLHIPTFMEKLKTPQKAHTEESGILHIMCALAAPFLYSDICAQSKEMMNSDLRFYDAGKGWADTALQYSFRNLGSPKLECLATEVLLHEYYLRTGEYSKALILSGQVARHLQLLQLNVECDPNSESHKVRVSTTTREMRRRLMWACYLLDALIECGVDQLRLISAEDIQVQLPCSEDYFIRGTPCDTELLSPHKLLPVVPKNLQSNLDMCAYYIRTISLRAKILKYVKALEGEIPWQSDTSKFSLLDGELQNLERSIPDIFKMTTANKYLYKALGRLNLFFGLHILLAQTSNDLHRICVAQLVFPDTSTKWIRDNAPPVFLERCHRMCLNRAVYIAKLLKDLWLFHKPSLIDTSYANHVQICSSVLLTTILSWGQAEPLLPQIESNDYENMLRDNLTILQYLQNYLKVDAYCQSAKEALRRFKKLLPVGTLSNPSHTSKGRLVNDQNVVHSQSSLDYILNPLGTYPLARKQTQDHDTANVSSDEVIMSESFDVMIGPQQPAADSSNLGSFGGVVSPSPFDWSETLMFDSAGYPTFLDDLTGWNAQTLEWNI